MEPERGGFGACTAGSHLRFIPFEFPVVEYGKNVMQTSSVPGKNKTTVQELDLITTDSRESCQT